MLLAELQGVKHLYQKTSEDIIKALDARWERSKGCIMGRSSER
jgi:hypothetical protein